LYAGENSDGTGVVGDICEKEGIGDVEGGNRLADVDLLLFGDCSAVETGGNPLVLSVPGFCCSG
jgi:hypothetical protein